MRPSQIADRHLSRRAIAYLRQSSLAQVRDHPGSTAVQRDLPAMIQSWGWRLEQIEVNDQDLGVSGSTPRSRKGFTQLLQEMRTGTVGIVAATDESRVARNLEDFAEFVAVARQHDVLYARSSQVIDFRDHNAELLAIILEGFAVRDNRARTAQFKLNRRKKAEDGLAPTRAPAGYVPASPGVWDKDPNPQVREVIHLVFDKFSELGSAAQVARWFRRSGIQLPGKRSRAHQPWRDATHLRVLDFLQNPVYSGTYIFGRTSVDETTKCRWPNPVSAWVIIENHHPPYVTPQQWAEIQRRLAENRNPRRPPLGRGSALVQGLLRCTTHNVPMQTFYPGRKYLADGGVQRSACYRCAAPPHVEPWRCRQILGSYVEYAVESEMVRTLGPPSLAELQAAAREALRTHEAEVRARQDELGRAEHAVDELEREFAQAGADESYFKARVRQRINAAACHFEKLKEFDLLNPLMPPLTIDEGELAELQRLVQDFPALWRHPNVTPEQRKAIVRTLIPTIEVTPRRDRWTLTLKWVGGDTTSVEVVTPRGVHTAAQQLAQEGLTPPEIAERFRQQGWGRPVGPLTATPYTEASIRKMLARALPRSLKFPAYSYISQRFKEGVPTRRIAEELNVEGFRHLYGPWEAKSVQAAIASMRRRPIPGIEPPRASPPPLTDSVRALYDAGCRSPDQIAEHLRQQDVRSRRGRAASKKSALLILWRLGLRPTRRLRSDVPTQVPQHPGQRLDHDDHLVSDGEGTQSRSGNLYGS